MILQWTEQELAAARPPEKLTLTEWACKKRELGKLSAITGKYKIEITPFFRPAMDRCTSPDVDEQWICAPAQIGKTVAFVENPAGYYMEQDPSSIMIVLADQQTAEYVATEKIAAMFRDSPDLSHLYHGPKFNKDTIDTPNGAHVDFAWSSSVSRLATRPERIVIFDEVDKPGYSKKSNEAGAISLGRERSESYAQGYYKHIFASTPTVDKGNISAARKTADICLDWHCPCPFCGVSQPLRWSEKYCSGFENYQYRDESGKMRPFGGVVWEGGRDPVPGTARYKCGSCGELWTNEQKNDAVRAGKEVARTEPTGNERIFWNHYNRIYSLLDGGRLETLVKKFTDCFRYTDEKRIEYLQGFINSALAEPFKQVVKKIDASDIYKAKVDLAPETVPEEAVALTCFVDVQKTGFWFAVRAWAKDSTSWLIHYGKLATWDDVEALLFGTEYPVENRGFSIGIWRAAIDTGGGEKFEGLSMTEETYHWLLKNGTGRGCRVWGTKGSTNPQGGYVRPGKILEKMPSGKPIPNGFQLMHLDTDRLKDAFDFRLKQAIAGGTSSPMYLNSSVGEDYIRQVTAEELQLDNNTGAKKWVRIRRDNHLLDCEIGNIALASREWAGGVATRKTPRPSPNKRRNNPGAPSDTKYKTPDWLRR